MEQANASAVVSWYRGTRATGTGLWWSLPMVEGDTGPDSEPFSDDWAGE